MKNILFKISSVLLGVSTILLNSTFATTIFSSEGVFDKFLSTKIKDIEVLKEIETLVKFNIEHFKGFLLRFDGNSLSLYSPLLPWQSATSVFYKAFESFKKLSNVENPYLTKKTLLDKELEVLNMYNNGLNNKYLKYVNKNLINKEKDGLLFDYFNQKIDPVTIVKYNLKYQPLINNKRISNFIYDKVESEGKDYIKNILGIKTNKCYNYQECAQKAFIGNNADNIEENKLQLVNRKIIFDNNVRALTLEQANIFINDFFLTDFAIAFFKKNGISIKNSNIIHLNKNKDIDINTRNYQYTLILNNLLLPLKVIYFNVTSLVNRYYSEPKQVIMSLIGCDFLSSKKSIACKNIKNSDWGKTETLAVKSDNNKTILLAFVSMLDLPSVYLNQGNTDYYPTKYEKYVYSNWLLDNFYAQNGLFSKDFEKMTKNNLSNVKNGYSAEQIKYLVNTKDLYHNKMNQVKLNENIALETVNATIRAGKKGIVKGFAINYFPTLSIPFKITLDNDTNTVNLLRNENSEYNKLLKKYYSIFKTKSTTMIGVMNNLYRNITITNEGKDLVVGNVTISDKEAENLYLNKTLLPGTLHFVKTTDEILTEDQLKLYYKRTIEKYNTIKILYNTLKNKLIKLDKEVSSLFESFNKNPNTLTYKQYIDKYAEYLLYASLYNSVKKVYYPFKFVVENEILGGFSTLNGDYSTHIAFTSAITYNKTTSLFKIFSNRYDKVLSYLENVLYIKKMEQMKKDNLYNVPLTKVIYSYSTITNNETDKKITSLFLSVLNSSRVNPQVKEILAKYNKNIHKVYDSLNYEKFIRFKNISDSIYNRSDTLIKISQVMKKYGINNLKNYYDLAQIYNYRIFNDDESDVNNYDLSMDYVVFVEK